MTATPILLGQRTGAGGTPLTAQGFTGALHYVRIHSEALTAGDILLNYEEDLNNRRDEEDLNNRRDEARAADALKCGPLHRYSFNYPGTQTTNVHDSAGTAHGTIRGAGYVWVGGQLELPGGSSATEAYVDLPNNLISGHANLTIELWVTLRSRQNWSRILDIGNNTAGEVTAPGGTFNASPANFGKFVMLAACEGTSSRHVFEVSGVPHRHGGTKRTIEHNDPGITHHHVITYSAARQEWRHYMDGLLTSCIASASGPAFIPDVNVWLGRSNFSADANFDGWLDECRIYNCALTDAEVLRNTHDGPDVLTVLPVPATFEEWVIENNPGAAINPAALLAYRTQDWDHDGISNALEFALLPMPGISTNAAPVIAAREANLLGGGAGWTFTYRRLVTLPGVTLVPEVTTDMSTWLAPQSVERIAAVDHEDGTMTETWRWRDPDLNYDGPGPVVDVGAVYLYTPTGTLISTVRGSTAADQVGSGGVTLLPDGNFVILSPLWNGAAVKTGAATWASMTAGIAGTVSAANSLVGSMANDQVGNFGATVLQNGNYVVSSPLWDGAVADVGAVTWCSGATGRAGTVSAANSLVGSRASDSVGLSQIHPLRNGNYVVASLNWNDVATKVGAATWGNGATGTVGVVSGANSLIGSSASDGVGGGGVVSLVNGNYVVLAPSWRNGSALKTGAVTWGDGATGTSGVVSADNSLIGHHASAEAGGGGGGVVALANGNYVVGSPRSNFPGPSGTIFEAGAVTWCSGTTGRSGVLSAGISCVGTLTNDHLGFLGSLTALTDGNYVLSSSEWEGPVSGGVTLDFGAAAWCDGRTGRTGTLSNLNALVGSGTQHKVGTRITALTDGSYLVTSPGFSQTTSPGVGLRRGAVTFCPPGGRVGFVTIENSLTGRGSDNTGAYYDDIGSGGAVMLTNGNFVVSSPGFDFLDGITTPAAHVDAGAATWCDKTGCDGVTVNVINSVHGSARSEDLGLITALANGHYVVASGKLSLGIQANVGGVRWCHGFRGATGTMDQSNSLVGSTPNDGVGRVRPLVDGNYVVHSSGWDNGSMVDSGAVTLCSGNGGTIGTINATNSVRGTAAGGGNSLAYDYDPARQQLIVGRDRSNIVTLFTTTGLATAKPVEISTFSLQSNGSFQLPFTGLSGARYSVLSSPDLSLPRSSWTSLGHATEISPGHFQYTSPAGAPGQRRFYVVRNP